MKKLDNTLSAAELQYFSVRRDIKKTNKLLNEINQDKNFGLSVLFSVLAAIIGALVGQMENIVVNQTYIIVYIIILAVPTVVGGILVCLKKKKIKKLEKLEKLEPKNHLSGRECIDKFDNEFCNYVSIASSYLVSLKTAAECGKNTHYIAFYYAQTCYYRNKAISLLNAMRPKAADIFSNSPSGHEKIAIDRLKNLMEILKLIYTDAQIYESSQLGTYNKQFNDNEAYTQALEIFEQDILDLFP